MRKKRKSIIGETRAKDTIKQIDNWKGENKNSGKGARLLEDGKGKE
jgi:hypothetical protein